MRRDRIDTGVWRKRAIARLCACVVGGTLTLASCAAVIGPQIDRQKHGIGGAIASILPKRARTGTGQYWHEHVVVVTQSQGFVSLGSTQSAAGIAALNASSTGLDDAWYCRLRESYRIAGFWAATSRTRTALLDVYLWSKAPVQPSHGDINDGQLRDLRSIALAGIQLQWPLIWPQSETDLVDAGVWTGSEPMPFGWLINAATIAGLAMFGCTVRGVVRDVNRNARAVKFLREHCCGWCGYDVRGLGKGTTVCPECGKPLREASRDVPLGCK